MFALPEEPHTFATHAAQQGKASVRFDAASHGFSNDYARARAHAAASMTRSAAALAYHATLQLSPYASLRAAGANANVYVMSLRNGLLMNSMIVHQ